jgi:glycosyltransferase involved in cell wall biosynthesis
MSKRKKLGILYGYNENWIAGTYYIHNLIHALNSLSDAQKPALVIYTGNVSEFEALQSSVNYPYMTRAVIPEISFIEKFFNKVSFVLARRQIAKIKLPVQLLFPIWDDKSFKKRQCLYWIPDFQEHYLPQFFSEEEIKSRKNWQSKLAKTKFCKIIFSSNAAFNDYKSIYPTQNTINYVVPFAVTHPSFLHLDIKAVKEKYNIQGEYFISPNQFWIHKNHRVVIDAVKILRDKGTHVCVAFTGKPHDPRAPRYFDDLKEYVQENKLEKNILFLGFIDRTEQLCLMKNANAVIQPSMFEGWSTVVEDAKAMEQVIIASNIAVHKEQLKDDAFFFDMHDAKTLADIIEKVNLEKPHFNSTNYQTNIEFFATCFLKAL